ncbi:MAG TPA: hypothetical protein VGG57_21575 [Stellaceae bacterium]|jgi:hypothetical protein
MCEALAAEPATAEWARQKGDARQMQRIWDKALEKTGDRAVVQIGSLAETVDATEEALLERASGIYQRGDVVVRPASVQVMVADERTVVALRLIEETPTHLCDRLSRLVDFQRYDDRRAKGSKWVSTDPPDKVARTYLGRVGEWKLPVLRGIMGAPTMRRDGSILGAPGYDEQTGLLFDPAGVEFLAVPASPSRAEGKGALAFLRELLSEFPFVGEGSEAVAISGICTGLVRQMLDHAPMHDLSAPVAGSGKSKCSAAIRVGRRRQSG